MHAKPKRVFDGVRRLRFLPLLAISLVVVFLCLSLLMFITGIAGGFHEVIWWFQVMAAGPRLPVFVLAVVLALMLAYTLLRTMAEDLGITKNEDDELRPWREGPPYPGDEEIILKTPAGSTGDNSKPEDS